MGSRYQSQSISGYNSNPPPDDGTTVAANKITWGSTIKAKLADPLNTFIAAVNSALVNFTDFSSVTTSTNLTTDGTHHMKTIEVTSGSPTISLGDAATMTNNYIVTVTNRGTGTPIVNLASAGNTLDGTVNGTITFPKGTPTSFTFKVINGATGYYTEQVGGNSILLNPNFTSAETAVGGSPSATAVAHGLGVVPRLVNIVLRNKTADIGYSPNDETAGGVNIAIDSTNITILVASTGVAANRKDTGAVAAISTANWKHVIRAWV